MLQRMTVYCRGLFPSTASKKTTEHTDALKCTRQLAQCFALTGLNRTGPPCSVDRPTAYMPGGRPGGGRLPTRPAAGRPARRQRYRRQTTTDDDDDKQQRPLLVCPPTLCVGEPVTRCSLRQQTSPPVPPHCELDET